LSDYYVNQFELNWLQVTGISYPDGNFTIKVDHSENYIWSFDKIIRNQQLSSGIYDGLLEDWVGRLTIDPSRWNVNDATASWTSPTIDIGEFWKPEAVKVLMDDRDDYNYVNTIIYWRASSVPPALNVDSTNWQSGELPHSSDDFSLLNWSILQPNNVIPDIYQYVQIKIIFITTDESITFPLIKTIKLSKKWINNTGLTLPADNLKYESGIFNDTTTTDFYGVELRPAIDSTSPLDGWWTSPIHDFGGGFHPRWASWYAFTPLGSHFDTLAAGGGTIQIRGSNVPPSGSWSQDMLPDADDPVWGIGGSLDTWVDIHMNDSILNILNIVQYAQIRIKFSLDEG
jgi:hypothetical protein